jgi:hypothetical protein
VRIARRAKSVGDQGVMRVIDREWMPSAAQTYHLTTRLSRWLLYSSLLRWFLRHRNQRSAWILLQQGKFLAGLWLR